ncbi:flagellar assembly protein FliX [Pseudodesulfovibrio sp.]|uniref:flagellar assembly protein FliX n=1 Tax=unclassified Pseudodesulfovibrio TaxID=2661612 RepID=UPI003B000781
MKIRPDQIEGLSQDQARRQNRAQQTDQNFGDILSQEVSKTQVQTTSLAAPQVVNPMLNIQSVQSIDAMGDAGATGQVESMLDELDNYAAALADPQGGLKEAYGSLGRIAEGVASLKESGTQLAPGLQSIVNDLETVTATEQFKFNRGDYI